MNSPRIAAAHRADCDAQRSGVVSESENERSVGRARHGGGSERRMMAEANPAHEAGSAKPGPALWWAMLLYALAVGVVAGFGAVAFRAMIGGFHNLLFLGQWSFDYDANVHTPPSPWGAGVILAPVLGAVGVAFLVRTFAPEAKGHGVPEVMEAIYYKGGRIRPVVALVKALASALSIGSGGSVGREGPIIQIGAAFGSTLGQMIPMTAGDRAVLISRRRRHIQHADWRPRLRRRAHAAGCDRNEHARRRALHRDRDVDRPFFFGALPSFNVPSLSLAHGPDFTLVALLLFALFGLLLGVLASAFARGIYWFEDRFDSMPGNYYTRHMSGMLVVGLVMYGFITLSQRTFGQPDHYYVEGVGYATIMDILRGDLTAPEFLLLLMATKLLVTCLTLGSGASGGVFSPAMFMGATLGGAFGSALQWIVPDLPAWSAMSPAHFAYAGMAGMVGGTTGAVITGTVMIFEMTRDYTVIMPVILTVALACAVRNWLSPATIYTLKLVRRGEIVPQGLQVHMGRPRAPDD
jgi:CIC family chloride channel protein